MVRSKLAPKVIVPPKEYTAEQVWAAACAANRINGSYIKYEDFREHGPVRLRNRDLMMLVLRESSATAEDIEMGVAARQYFQGLLLKQLTGKINSFEQSSLACAGKDSIMDNDYLTLSIIASLPASYSRGLERDRSKEEMSYILENSSHIGQLGDKIYLPDVQVLRSVYSINYNTHFITGVSDKNVVFFAYKEPLTIGAKVNISGRTKQHRDQGQTQLNRVKIK